MRVLSFRLFVLVVSVLARPDALQEDVAAKLSRLQRIKLNKDEKNKYLEMRKQGIDEVSHTPEAAAMRNYQLRKKKRSAGWGRKDNSLAAVLFPGVSPQDYPSNEEVIIYTDMVNSKKTSMPFDFYDLPFCPPPTLTENRKGQIRKNLGARLQGAELKAAPYVMRVKQNNGCVPICQVNIPAKKLRWLRKLVERQYRVHLTFDHLPILMRSKELNYAIRGYPLGFQAPPSFTGLAMDEYYIYNHLKFSITYQEDAASFDGVRITGFDVHPVSYAHDLIDAQQYSTVSEKPFDTKLSRDHTSNTCQGMENQLSNDPSTYLALRSGDKGEDLIVLYSYEVEWVASELPWSDRWDVYLIGNPDDDIHYFAIVNSLMIVLFLTGAIATIMIRTLRKDIAGYNDTLILEDSQEETGWKLVHGDVFRAPSFSPMLLSILVGSGAQIGSAFILGLLCAIFSILNPMNKGQFLTALLILYVISGFVGGFLSARLYKFYRGRFMQVNTFLQAISLPGIFASIFLLLNCFLSYAGAATAVTIYTIGMLFGLWVFVCTPLVIVGSYAGFGMPIYKVPTKTQAIPRAIPELPWYSQPPFSVLLGGVLPFGSVCIELFFIMSALWLHQIYYVMGFLLCVVLILTATCAEVSVVMCYLQLCSEDHEWWWKAFLNTGAAGLYLFVYSLWFLVSRLDLVGVLPVVVYLTYMAMISVCFGLFCGAVGVFTCFWFNRTIYGAVKVD